MKKKIIIGILLILAFFVIYLQFNSTYTLRLVNHKDFNPHIKVMLDDQILYDSIYPVSYFPNDYHFKIKRGLHRLSVSINGNQEVDRYFLLFKRQWAVAYIDLTYESNQPMVVLEQHCQKPGFYPETFNGPVDDSSAYENIMSEEERNWLDSVFE